MPVCQPLHVAEKTLLAQHTYLQAVCPETGQVAPFPSHFSCSACLVTREADREAEGWVPYLQAAGGPASWVLCGLWSFL